MAVSWGHGDCIQPKAECPNWTLFTELCSQKWWCALLVSTTGLHHPIFVWSLLWDSDPHRKDCSPDPPQAPIQPRAHQATPHDVSPLLAYYSVLWPLHNCLMTDRAIRPVTDVDCLRGPGLSIWPSLKVDSSTFPLFHLWRFAGLV
jgi:hypothetical protein